MRRYWDLSEKVRACLTEEQIEVLLSYELMERGVVRLPPPILEEIVPVATATTTVYGVRYGGYHETSVVFPTSEEAHRFLALKPMALESHYPLAERSTRALDDAAVFALSVLGSDALREAKGTLTENHARKDRNEEATKAYEKAEEAITAETADLRKDWHRCQDLERQCRRVLSTWKAYQGMTNGDLSIAWTFLLKAFPGAADSFKWLGEPLPACAHVETNGQAPLPMPAVAAST